MSNEAEERLILRRGMAEHSWTPPTNYVPPPIKEPFHWRIPAVAIPAPAPERAGVWTRRARTVAGVVAVVSLAILALQASVKGFHTEGISMQPTLHNGDRVVVNRLAYAQLDFGLLDWAPLIDPGGHWRSPARGDIIAFKSPVKDRELIKRVIGLPGDRVMVLGGHVFVNEKPLDEPYAAGPTYCDLDGDGDGNCTWTVEPDHYFVMGDNRMESHDSRQGWTVPAENIAGEKLLSY